MSESVVLALIALFPSLAAGVFMLWQTRRTTSATQAAARLAAEAQERIARMDDLQKFVDQVQEQLQQERTAREAEVLRLRAELGEVRLDLAAVLRTNRIQDQYILKLRRWISDGNPPPPPDYPVELVA